MNHSFKSYKIMMCLFGFICLWSGNISCQQIQKSEEINSLESEMISYFKETLEKNYGRTDGNAIQLLMEGLVQYNFHYILDVDRVKLKKMYNSHKKVFQEYFFDYPTMEKKMIKPDRWMTDLPFDPYTPFGLTEQSSNNYLRSELAKSEHPLLKEVVELHRALGEFTFSPIWGKLNSNKYNSRDSFKDNKEIQLFVTIFFWEYLCYCANIDFVHNADKTSLIKTSN